MDLDAVADELYGLRPDEFTAVRNQRAAKARTDGNRELAEEIKALHRPTLSAWASNLLVREMPGEVEPLLRLGAGLRAAHRDMDGDQLRELSRRQHALIAALSRQARQLAAEAGQNIGEDAQRQIEETLRAVLSDPDAAQQWASARLAKPLTAPTGFAAAGRGLRVVPSPSPRQDRTERTVTERTETTERTDRTEADERRRRRIAEALREADRAEQEVHEQQQRTEQHRQDVQDAEEKLAGLRRRARQLAEELKDLESQARQAEAKERRARDRERADERVLRQAQRRAEAAAARLKRLTDGD
ncbi:hypothetical protein AB0D34_18060 [Streptomyces sp. NPDC048420]|uniref:hypothetical protein n=1 Tax=Streptomyces sp. NPDC048420 TaxID=3155755 RepID=UPI00344A3463